MPSWGNHEIYAVPLDAIREQKYSNWELWYIADNDYDPNSRYIGLRVQEYARKYGLEHKIKVFRNKERQLALANLYKMAIRADDHAILVFNDADDVLAHQYVFAYLNSLYQKNDLMLTFGSSLDMSTGKRCSWANPIPKHVVEANAFRTSNAYAATHLRTCRAGLFKKIHIEDLFYQGEMFKKTYDVALFMPMLEMAGHRHTYVPDVLLIYNDLNPINDHKQNQQEQLYLNKYIRSLPPYSRLVNGSVIFKKEAHKKSDVVYVAQNVDEAKKFLSFLHDLVRGVDAVYVLFPVQQDNSNGKSFASLAQQFSIILEPFKDAGMLGEKLKNIAQRVNQFVLFAYRAFDSRETIDLEEAVSFLRTTHAYGFYMRMMRNAVRYYTLLSDEVCAWQFDSIKLPEEALAWSDMVIFPKNHFIEFVRAIDVMKISPTLFTAGIQKTLTGHVGLCYAKGRI